MLQTTPGALLRLRSYAAQSESEEGGELAVALALQSLAGKRGEIGEVRVLGEGGGHPRVRNPARLSVAPIALDVSEDAHVVGAIVDLAKGAGVHIAVPIVVHDARAEDHA